MIDLLVYKLYGLDEEEIRFIEKLFEQIYNAKKPAVLSGGRYVIVFRHISS